MRRTGMTFVCAHCSKAFHPHYGREKTSRFCSRTCYLTSRWGPTPTVKSCAQCGKDISNSGRRSSKYCSSPCKVAASIGRTRPRALIRYGSGGRYRARRVPEHPHADSKGYMLEHRLMMEKHIGRYLTSNEVVHHRDENPTNNAIGNLVLMTRADHDSLHSSKRWAEGKMDRQIVTRPSV